MSAGNKRFEGAPFGIQCDRFTTAGIYPRRKVPGTFTTDDHTRSGSNPNLGPGKYDIGNDSFSPKAIAARAAGPGWARAWEVSRQAGMPHILHKEQWEAKKEQKRKLGPGTYEIKDPVYNNSGSTRGLLDMKECRFKETINNYPGPGSYGYPNGILEEKQKKSPGNVGILDSKISSDRSLPMTGCHLAPGTYNHKNTIDELTKKVVSLRGPYDVFSEDRNKPIKTGHYAVEPNNKLGPGEYKIKSSVDELTSEHRKYHGKFGKVAQYPKRPSERLFAFHLAQNPRDPSEPSPAHYSPSSPGVRQESFNAKLPPFMSCSQRSDKRATMFFTGNYHPVGPGRYDIQKWHETLDKNGLTSVFRSRTDRPNLERQKVMYERLKPRNLDREERGVQLVC